MLATEVKEGRVLLWSGECATAKEEERDTKEELVRGRHRRHRLPMERKTLQLLFVGALENTAIVVH